MSQQTSDEESVKLHDAVDIILSESKPEELFQEEETVINEAEDKRLQREAQKLANKLRKERLKGQKQDRKQRKNFSYMIFYFLCAYLVFVFVVLFFSGFSGLIFRMADSVLITLLSTTTVNVISIFILVVKYLFPTERSVP